MVGLIVDLKPMRIKKIQKQLQEESDIANRRLKISEKLNQRIQKNPVRSKFQID